MPIVTRVRRVKCDERKPKCFRCTKFGTECDGYEDVGTPPPGYDSRELLPKNNQVIGFPFPVSGVRAITSVAALRSLPPSSLFENQLEFQYFRHFRDETALNLSGGFDATLWNQVILQACESEPSLRQLTISIGALSKAQGSDSTATDLNKQFALVKYGRALRGIHDTLSKRQNADSTRIALIASLLIYCFENLHGDTRLAISHIQSALHLLHKRLSSIPRPYQHLLNDSPTPDLEGDLIKAFVRLDSALVSRLDNPNPAAGNILGITCASEPYLIPTTFTTVTEARRYLEHLQYRTLSNLPKDLDVEMVEMPQTADEFAKFSKRPTFVSAATLDALTSQVMQWQAAYASLFKSACAVEGDESFIAAAMLRTQALSLAVTLRIHLPGLKTSSDAIVPESYEIVSLSRRIVSDARFRKGFVFDAGIIQSLFTVVFTCQKSSVRREAIEILREAAPRKEGLWDSLTVAKLGEMLLEIEEKGPPPPRVAGANVDEEGKDRDKLAWWVVNMTMKHPE